MICYCEQTDKGFYYIIKDAPESSHELIVKAFFKKDGGLFRKWYPLDAPDKDIAALNYERLAPVIFTRECPYWENALDEFCRKAKKHSIDFVLRGSAAARIHGVDAITPTDIDINVDVMDFEKTRNVFIDHMIEPFDFNDNLLMVKYFGRLCLGNVWADVSAYPKNGYGVSKIDTVIWNGHIIKVQSLRSCLDVYKAMGSGYINEIEEYLISH